MASKQVKGIGQREFSSVINTSQQENRRLWRDQGRAVVANIFGELRYLYDDGSFDPNSTVDSRVEHTRARFISDVVVVTDKGLPDFVEDWRVKRVKEAVKDKNKQNIMQALGAKVLIVDKAPTGRDDVAHITGVLPDTSKSNIIELSLPETATGKNLENVA